MSKLMMAKDLRLKIRSYADKILQSKLKFWLEDKKSESWVMSELSIPVFMKFRMDLTLDTTPIKVNGKDSQLLEVDDLKSVQREIFIALDQQMEKLELDGWEAPQRRLAHRTPPTLDGQFEPVVARRGDLKISSEQKQAMQHLTNTPWVINQKNWDDIKEFRESLSDEDRNKIFYDYEDEEIGVLMSEEEESGDKLASLFDRIGSTVFFLVTRRMDEAGRMYPSPMHPVYSRWLRCVFQYPSQELTEDGWRYLRKHIKESYGLCNDAKRDAWARNCDRDPQKLFTEKGKKGADELAAARGWLEARETGATGCVVFRDFVAQGMGLIAAREGCRWHHDLVNVNSDEFISAHDRFSGRMQDVIRNFRIHSFDALKGISKSCITPGMYGGGRSAISCKLTEMSKDAFGEWNYGEDGSKLPVIDPILLDYIGKDLSTDEQMDEILKLSEKFTEILHSTFPFLEPYQEAVRRHWKGNIKNGKLPIFSGTDGYEYQSSPFKVNKKLTRAVRFSRYRNGKRVSQPSVQCWLHQLEETGTPMCAKIIFMLDRLIAIRIILALAKRGIYVCSIHDAFGVHPNYGYILEQVATEAYNSVMSENAEVIGRSYRRLPDSAVLLRA